MADEVDAQIRDASARIAALEAALAAERDRAAALTAERDRLREAYQRLQLELELMRRRLFVAKAERIDTAQLELEFASKLAALDALGQQLIGGGPATTGAESGGPERPPTRSRPRPTGRRELRDVDLPEQRIELADPPGPPGADSATRIRWEESCQIYWRRGGFERVVIARAVYKDDAAPADPGPAPREQVSVVPPPARIYTVPMPLQILPRSIATASLAAHVVAEKFCEGMPLHRQEDQYARLGVRLDRGMMSRWLEELGGLVGSSVVAAMRDDALRTAFCIATDATGVLVQPIAGGDAKRRGCRRGHFFVQIADADHVFFEYTPRETSAAVSELFKGFSGYVQADAKSVYDLLFAPPSARPPPRDDDGEGDAAAEPDAVRHEVGCWAHCRRKFWEAAVTTKDPVAREALARIQRIFAFDRIWSGLAPTLRKRMRDDRMRPHTDAFFAWVADEYERVKDQRGMLRSALGYAHRQRGPLTRFYDDGRLQLTNNHSERELRRVAVGRKAWLFVGSDDHAQAAGNLLSLVASARLHRLDPEAYLRDLFRVLPHWPRDRYLELCPRDWPATRSRLVAAQLEAELGPLVIPPPPTA